MMTKWMMEQCWTMEMMQIMAEEEEDGQLQEEQGHQLPQKKVSS